MTEIDLTECKNQVKIVNKKNAQRKGDEFLHETGK